MEGLSEIQQFVMGMRQPTQSSSAAAVPHYPIPHPSSNFTTVQQYHYHQHQPLLHRQQTSSEPTLSQADELLLAQHRSPHHFLLPSSRHLATSPSQPPLHIINQQPYRSTTSPTDQPLIRTSPPPRYYYNRNANTQFPMTSCLPAIPPSNPSVSSQLNSHAAQFMDHVAVDSQWTAQETVALLQIMSDLEANNKGSVGNTNLYRQISRRLSELGFNRSLQECKEKLEFAKAGGGFACAQVSGQLEVMLHAEAASNNKGNGKISTAWDNSDNDNNDNNNNNSNNFTSSGETQDRGNNSAGRDINSSASGGSSDYVDETRIEESEERTEFEGSLSYKQVAGLGMEEGEAMRLSSMRKRKRKQLLGGSSGVEEEKLLEKLAKQVMKQQEALHHKFLERLEKRDEERAIREQARKREEASRAKREHEARAQEYALAAKRDAALLAFLHKLNGQISIHPTTSTSNVCPTMDLLNPQQHRQPAGNNNNEEENEKEHSDRRWPKVEVHGLIRVRSGMEPRFQEAGPKAQLWEEISNSMACMGFQRSAKRCKEKWENINKYYRKTKDNCRKRPENAKTCPYFHQLEMLYSKGILHSPPPITTKAHNEKQQQQQGFQNEEVQQLLLTENSICRPPNGGDSSSSLTTTTTNNNNNNNNAGGESMACMRMEGLAKDILHMQQQE